MVTGPEHVAFMELKNIPNSVALDGNPEPDLVHATGCKQPNLRSIPVVVYYFIQIIR
jgi:hypothetical protein